VNTFTLMRNSFSIFCSPKKFIVNHSASYLDFTHPSSCQSLLWRWRSHE
jgi:hypothetical protein